MERSPWTDDDAGWAEILAESLPLLPGEKIEHYIVCVSAGSGEVDGQIRRVLVATCCRGTSTPTHLMSHVQEILTQNN